MHPVTRRLARTFLALLAVAATAVVATGTSSAQPTSSPRLVVPEGAIAVTPSRTFALPLNSNSSSAWAQAPDGTFWTANTGAVVHSDDHGTDLGDGFTTSSAFVPSQVAVDGSRLFLSYPGEGVAAYALAGGSGQTPVTFDAGTTSRYNGQAYVTVRGGTLFLPTGQANKIGFVDLSTFGTQHYYPQSWYGLNINDNPPPVHPAWEACIYDGGGMVNGTVANCGTHGGTSADVLDYPVDVAVGSNSTLFVLNNNGNDVSTLSSSSAGYVPDGGFGSTGSGNGQLAAPTSIVRDPATGDLFITDSGNDRISEFGPGGVFLASFGYGVLDGGSGWEACGVGIGDCHAGLAHHYYAQLALHGSQLFVEDIGADNLRGHLQVLDLGDGTAAPSPMPTTAPSPAAPTGAAPTTAAPTTAAPTKAAAKKPTVKLKADHTSVKSKAHAKLTATVGPTAGCSGRTVAFQVQKGRTWVTLTRLKTGRQCTATLTSSAITATVKIRAVLQSSARKTLATSSTVVIRLKR